MEPLNNYPQDFFQKSYGIAKATYKIFYKNLVEPLDKMRLVWYNRGKQASKMLENMIVNIE